MDIVCEDHVTKAIYWKDEKAKCMSSKKTFFDLSKSNRTYRMIGTVEQIDKMCCDMIDRGVQWKDYYKAPLKEKYLDLYKKNNSEVIIINLIDL